MTDTNTQELAKSFDPAAIEARWYPIWEERGYFKAGLDPKKPSFSIQLPPPNITGILHMGHAFNQTVMDTLTRYHRMAGYNTVWIPGTDHAGIATQIVVERKLEKQGIDYKSLTREQFIEKSGNGSSSRAARFSTRCAASATASTGTAPTSRWTKSSPRS